MFYTNRPLWATSPVSIRSSHLKKATTQEAEMPQGRHKVPFSGKAKKAQMQQKRDRIHTKKRHQPEETKGETGAVPCLAPPLPQPINQFNWRRKSRQCQGKTKI